MDAAGLVLKHLWWEQLLEKRDSSKIKGLYAAKGE